MSATNGPTFYLGTHHPRWLASGARAALRVEARTGTLAEG